jgi:hypothetical protein
MYGLRKNQSTQLGSTSWTKNSESANVLRAKQANEHERRILKERCRKLNDDRLHSLNKIRYNNLQLQYEFSQLKRSESLMNNIDFKQSDPSVIYSVFDEEKSLIGFYEASLTKMLMEQRRKSKIVDPSVPKSSQTLSNPISSTSIPSKKNVQNKRSTSASSVTSLPRLSLISQKNEIVDKVTSSFEIENRKKSINPDYKISLTKGVVKRFKKLSTHQIVFRPSKRKNPI